MAGNHPTHLTSLAEHLGEGLSGSHSPLEDPQRLLTRPDQTYRAKDVLEPGVFACGVDRSQVVQLLPATAFRTGRLFDSNCHCHNLLSRKVLMSVAYYCELNCRMLTKLHVQGIQPRFELFERDNKNKD